MSVKLWCSALARKSQYGINQLPLAVARLRASPQDYLLRPSILVNSLPKSGTHLLMQVAEALPNSRRYGNFIAERSSISMRPRGQAYINSKLQRIVPGEIVGAHLNFSAATADTIRQVQTMHLFIFRDPRAVVVSEVHYLENMAPWNSLSKRFKTAGDLKAQIDLVIYGDGTPELPPIGERYGRYLAWRDDPNTLSIEFESLIDPESRQTSLKDIAKRYIDLSKGTNNSFTTEHLATNISPESSHTFSNKDPARWRRVLTQEQISAILEKF